VRLFWGTKPLYFSINVDIFHEGVKLDQREFFLGVSVNLEGGGYFYLKDAKSTEIKQGMKTKRISCLAVSFSEVILPNYAGVSRFRKEK